MIEQEVFDRTVRHLHTQGGPAMAPSGSPYTCAYRGDGGRSCAVGYWIPDSLYLSCIEGADLCSLNGEITPFMKRVLPTDLHEHGPILHELQRIHDASLAENGAWVNVHSRHGIAGRLAWLAGVRELNPAVVFECWPLNFEKVA